MMLIVDTYMPEHCLECPFFDGHCISEEVNTNESFHGHHQKCPIKGEIKETSYRNIPGKHICSCCGQSTIDILFNYCPNCGTKIE